MVLLIDKSSENMIARFGRTFQLLAFKKYVCWQFGKLQLLATQLFNSNAALETLCYQYIGQVYLPRFRRLYLLTCQEIVFAIISKQITVLCILETVLLIHAKM